MELQEIEVKIKPVPEDPEFVIATPKRVSTFHEGHVYGVLRQGNAKTEIFRIDGEGKYVGIEEPPGPGDLVTDLTQMFNSATPTLDPDEIHQVINNIRAYSAYDTGVSVKPASLPRFSAKPTSTPQSAVTIGDWGTQECCEVDDRIAKKKNIP